LQLQLDFGGSRPPREGTGLSAARPIGYRQAKEATLTTQPEPAHLDNRHRDTLRRIFEHPVSHNLEWRSALSLLEAVGSVEQRHDGKFVVALGSATETFERPAGKDLEVEQVLRLRRMLSAAGYAAEAWQSTHEVPEVDAASGGPGSGAGLRKG
jgi:hypothetical protein